MSAQTPAKITLEEITQRKKKLLNEIQAQKRAMTATTREIFSPLAPAANKADSLMRSFNTGMAIFDGVVLGIKIMKKMRRYFRRLREQSGYDKKDQTPTPSHLITTTHSAGCPFP